MRITARITGQITGKDGGSEEAAACERAIVRKPAEKTATLVASARAQAIRLLARREHSRKELRAKLHARGHADAAVEDALEALEASDLQSDRRFAEGYVRSALGRGHGERKIRAGLAERGVEPCLVAEFLNIDDDAWERLATAALVKRFGEGAAEDAAERRRRLRFLAGRGFGSAVAVAACNGAGSDHALDA